jgi:large repetitive protein
VKIIAMSRQGRLALAVSVLAIAVPLATATAAGEAPSLTTPRNGTQTNDATPTFAGTASNVSSTITIEIFQGAAEGQRAFRSFSLPVSAGAYSGAPTEPLPDGRYTARARQRDRAGRDLISNVSTFTVDTVAPTVRLAEPAPGAILRTASPIVKGTAEPRAVTISISPGTAAAARALRTLRTTAGGDGKFSAKVDSPLDDGVWTVLARQTDQAGNTGSSAAFSFQVDTGPPEVILISGPVPLGLGTRTVRIEFGADEPATFRCRLDNASRAAPCRSPLVLRELAAGRHALTIVAVDRAGNEDPTPAVLRFTIDVAAPNLSVAPRLGTGRSGAVSIGLRCLTSQSLGPCVGTVTLRRAGRALLTKPLGFRVRSSTGARLIGQLRAFALRELRQRGSLAVELVVVAVDGRNNVGRARLKRTLVYPK